MSAWWLPLLVLSQLDGLELSWTAPEPCPSVEALRARLPGVRGQAQASARPDGAQWLLEVRVNGAARTLAAASCDEAADAAVLIIQLGLGAPPPSPPEEPPPPPAPWSVRAGVLGGISLGWLPMPLARAGVAVSLHRAALALTLDVHTVPVARFSGGPSPDAAVSLSVPLEGALGACWMFEAGRLRAGPCAQLTVSWFQGRGLGVSEPRSSSAVLVSGTAGARAYFAMLRWLELFAAGGARLGSRPSVSFGEQDALVQASLISLELGVGLGVRFGG